MKLIHTADLHLGARTEAKLPPRRAEERRAELLATLADIATLAKREEAALLIAGDLFDTATPSRRTLTAFLDIVHSHPTVRFFCLPGNHDGGGFPAVECPENLHLFGREWSSVSVGDTDFYGIAPEGDIPYDALNPDPERRNVVLLHGAVREGGTPEPGAVVLSRLAGRGIDYLALGHYHSHRVGRLDARGVYAYSGTPEGRGMDEAGECGVLLVDTALSPIAPVFLPTARRRIHRLPVDVTEGPVRTAIEAAVVNIPEGDLVRIELVGALAPDAPRPDLARLTSLFENRFYYFEIKDKCTLAISPDDYLGSLNLKGEFVRQVMAAALSEEEKTAILRAGLAALRGEEDEI